MDVVERALGACELEIIYGLGAGAPWTSPTPGDEQHCCDCSGFVAWVFGYARYQPTFAWLRALNGGWMNTDGIVEDSRQPTGLWSRSEDPGLGQVLVYPSRSYARSRHLDEEGNPGPAIGHVGVIVKGAPGMRVVHCSAGNMKRFDRAIAETSAEVLLKVPYVITARYAGMDEEKPS